jgi:hypothetical protein
MVVAGRGVLMGMPAVPKRICAIQLKYNTFGGCARCYNI